MRRRQSRTAGLPQTLAATVTLGIVMATLPFVGEPSFTSQIVSYALVLLPAGFLLHALANLLWNFPTPWLLTIGAAAALLGVLAAALGGKPETLEGGTRMLPLILLFFADVLRMFAAAALGFSLARHVTSAGVALLIAAVATVSDLFSVFTGPTRALVREVSPALDYLLLIFPAAGQPLGFALGVADIIFIAIFAGIARSISLRYRLTLISAFIAVFTAMTTALVLNVPLPALPFIALSFFLANADVLLKQMRIK